MMLFDLARSSSRASEQEPDLGIVARIEGCAAASRHQRPCWMTGSVSQLMITSGFNSETLVRKRVGVQATAASSDSVVPPRAGRGRSDGARCIELGGGGNAHAGSQQR